MEILFSAGALLWDGYQTSTRDDTNQGNALGTGNSQGSDENRISKPSVNRLFTSRPPTFWEDIATLKAKLAKPSEKKWASLKPRADQIQHHFEKRYEQWVNLKTNQDLCEETNYLSAGFCMPVLNQKIVDKIGINPILGMGLLNTDVMGKAIAFINPQRVEKARQAKSLFENEIKGLYKKFVEARVADQAYMEGGVYSFDESKTYPETTLALSGLRVFCRTLAPKWMNQAITYDHPDIKEKIIFQDQELSRAGLEYLRESLPRLIVARDFFQNRKPDSMSKELIDILDGGIHQQVQEVARVLVAIDQPENDWARTVFYIDGTIKPGMEETLLEKLFPSS